MSPIKVYGADWCHMTAHTCEHLDELGVDYDYINVDADPQASQWVKAQNNGKERKPTVEINGRVLRTPTDDELDAALEEAGVHAR